MSVFWVKNTHDASGRLHSRADKPSRISIRGDKEYHRHGKLHRENDKPALVYSDDETYMAWYQNGMVNRGNDQPARVWSQGGKEWYRRNQLHREAGPADIHPNQPPRWALFDSVISERVHRRLVAFPARWRFCQRGRMLRRSMKASRRFRRCLLAMPTGHISKHFPGGRDWHTLRDELERGFHHVRSN